MKSLLETAQALRDTKERADAMNELATKDALTGIRNKTAYDNEVRRIEWKMSSNEKLEPWEKVSASIGIAVYDSNIDANVANVFKRADKAMYQRKKEMKAVREK